MLFYIISYHILSNIISYKSHNTCLCLGDLPAIIPINAKLISKTGVNNPGNDGSGSLTITTDGMYADRNPG